MKGRRKNRQRRKINVEEDGDWNREIKQENGENALRIQGSKARKRK